MSGHGGTPLPLRELLAQFRTKDTDGATHTSFEGGMYCVPASWHPNLYIAYADAIERGERLALVERHRHIGPVVIDLDFRPLPGAPPVPDGQHLYAPDEVRRFVVKLFAQLDGIVDMRAAATAGKGTVSCVVLEKPRRSAKNGTVKDGIHFMLPHVVTRVETQMALREAMLQAVAQDFGGKCDGPKPGTTPTLRASSIYDDSVLQANGWMMLGSRKVHMKTGEWEPHPWKVTRVFRLDPDTFDTTELPELDVNALTSTPENRRALVRLLSIRNKWDETPLTASGDERIEPLVRKSREEHVRRMEAEADARRGDDTDGGSASSAPVCDDALAALIALLSRERAVPYATWYPVGQCLANVTGKSDAGLALFHAFSRRADEAPSVPAAAGDGNGVGDGAGAVYDSRSCDTTWRGLTVRPANKLGMGSLCWWANEDDPDGYKAWQAAHGRAQDISGGLHPLRTRVPPELRVAIFDQCAAQWPDIFSAAAIDAFTLEHDEAGLCFSFGEGGGGGTISRDGLVVTLADGRVLGSVLKNTPLNRSLAFMHANVPTTINEYVFNNVSTEQSQIDSRPPGTSLTLFHGPSPFVNINTLGRQARVTVREKVSSLSKMLETALLDHARNMLGEPAANAIFIVNNGIFNNGTIIAGKEEPRHTDEELLNIIESGAPDFIKRIVYDPLAKATGNSNGIFVCDPDTNLWVTKVNEVLEQELLKLVRQLRMTAADRRHVESVRGRADMLYALKTRHIDVEFANQCNANPSLFTFKSGDAYDIDVGAFRRIEPTDKITMFVPWAYDPEASRAHRMELDEFLARLLPVPEERRVVLAFFAALMSGRRTAKKAMVFTDKRIGNTGKSTLSSLLQDFFGSEYVAARTEFVCQASFDKGRDSHDAGMQTMAGKRLLVAEELTSHSSLDMGFIKKHAGGARTIVEGRTFREAFTFKYVWQAGILLLFNEGQCPKFDATDLAFQERLIVAPFRSKFVAGLAHPLPDAPEGPTYPMDTELDAKFERWRSALFDVFREHLEFAGSLNNASMLPAAMREWRQNLAEEANPLADWLERTFEVTGNAADFILLGDAKVAFYDTRSPLAARVPDTKFVKLGKTYFTSMPGVTYEDHKWCSELNKTVRALVRGARSRVLPFTFPAPDPLGD